MHIDTAQYNETAELLKVIAHPVRLCIVRGLWQGGGCNVSHMLDKTGTITLGNRQASAFLPVDGATEAELADAAQLSSLADETPEGRSIVVLAKERFGLRGRELRQNQAEFVPFTAQTRMQVFVNLLDNALKYTPPDTEICLSARKQNGFAIIEAADDGPGIPLEDKAHGNHRGPAGQGDSGQRGECAGH